MEQPRIVKAVTAQEDLGRTTPRLLVRGADGNDYFAKPWHNDRAINYENQLRGWVGTQVAHRLGLDCVPGVVALVGLDVHIDFVLGTNRLPGKVDYHEAPEDHRAAIENQADIPRIVFLDILLLNSDRKEHNSNLVILNRRLYMVDLDNFFTNAPKFVEGGYEGANEDRRQYLTIHPLRSRLPRDPDSVVRTLEELRARLPGLLPDAWLDELKNATPPSWFKSGGGDSVVGMLRHVRNGALEVASIISEVT